MQNLENPGELRVGEKSLQIHIDHQAFSNMGHRIFNDTASGTEPGGTRFEGPTVHLEIHQGPLEMLEGPGGCRDQTGSSRLFGDTVGMVMGIAFAAQDRIIETEFE